MEFPGALLHGIGRTSISGSPQKESACKEKASTTQFRTHVRGGWRSAIIAANSPQAKGSAWERNNGVHQDRLVKKLRRKGIQDYEAANAYLEAEYLPEHNRRFGARRRREPEDYHVRTPSAARLREVFSIRDGNDGSATIWVVQ